MFTKKSFSCIILIAALTIAFWFSHHAFAKANSDLTLAVTQNNPVIGEPFPVSSHLYDDKMPAVIHNSVDREFLVVWSKFSGSKDEIYAQRISENGKLLSGFYVGDGDYPAVAYNEKNNTYLVVYTKLVSTDFDIYARRVNSSGPMGPEFPIAFNLDESETRPSVAYNTHPNYDSFLVVWDNDIYGPPAHTNVEGQLIAGAAGGGDAGGENIGGRLIIANTGYRNFDNDVAYNLNMNEFFVVYIRQLTDLDDLNLFGRRITRDGILLAETNIDSSANDQVQPAVAAYRLNSDTPYLVVFHDYWNDTAGDVRGYLIDQQGQPNTLVNIAAVPGEMEWLPAISQSESWGGYLVTWSAKGDTSWPIHGRVVSNSGLAELPFIVSEDPLCAGMFPSIASGEVSALAVWVQYCASRQDVYGRMLGYRMHLPVAIR